MDHGAKEWAMDVTSGAIEGAMDQGEIRRSDGSGGKL